MAKVRSPLHSIGLRGRIADGFVFTVWRGINCLRTFVMPSQPRTQRKEQVWKTTPRVTRAWAGLTDAERASWEEFARLLKPTDPTLRKGEPLVRVQRLSVREPGLSGCGTHSGHPAPSHPPAQPAGKVQTPKPGPGSRQDKVGAVTSRNPHRPLAQPDQSLPQGVSLQVPTPRLRRRNHGAPHPLGNPFGNEGSRERQGRETRRRKVRLRPGGNRGLRK